MKTKVGWFIAGCLTAAVCSVIAGVAFIVLVMFPHSISANASAIENAADRPVVESVAKRVSNLYERLADTAQPGEKYEIQRFDENTSVLVEKCPFTKAQEAAFGHEPCEQMTVEEFREQGIVTGGETVRVSYTWVSDSVISLGVLAELNGLHVEDGIYKDEDGYAACYSRTNKYGDIVETPVGQGKIYDAGSDWKTIGVFVSG